MHESLNERSFGSRRLDVDLLLLVLVRVGSIRSEVEETLLVGSMVKPEQNEDGRQHDERHDDGVHPVSPSPVVVGAHGVDDLPGKPWSNDVE